MAESLSVRIALEGGEEIERQLAEIGDAGKRAFGEIAQSAEKVGGFRNIKPEEVTAKLKDLGVTGVESINKIQAAVRSAGRLEGLVQGIETAQAAFVGLGRAAGVVGVAVAAGLVALTKQTFGFAQAINKTSAEAIKLGLSFETLDQLRRTMEQAGMAAPAVNSGIATLKNNLDKLEVGRLQKIVEGLQKVSTLGVRFAPGQGPDALRQLQEAATKIGPAGDFAREALRKLNLEAQKTSNVRFLPGVVPTLEQLRADVDPVVAGLTQLGIAANRPIGEQYTQITEKLKAMTDVTERNRLALLLLGEAAGTAFIQSLPSMNAAEDAANKLVGSINRLTAAWKDFGSLTLAPTLTAGIDLITAAVKALQEVILNFSWQNLANAGVAVMELLRNAAEAFTLQGMLSWITRVTLAWTGLFDLIAQGFARMQQMQAPGAPLPEPGGIPMAGGGLLGGRGTGTSDSNLAWLSRGEFVVPARAVRQPGMLALLEALRRSGGNLRGVLDDMGHFARGGLVLPALASGGINRGGSSSRVLNLTIEGRSFGGLSVPEATAQSLERFAVHSQIASTGRRPSWKR